MKFTENVQKYEMREEKGLMLFDKRKSFLRDSNRQKREKEIDKTRKGSGNDKQL